MSDLSRLTFDSMTRLARRGADTYAELDLYVPAFERVFPVEIHISNGSSVVSDKTLQTVREIASLPQEARARVQTLLYEDALRASMEVAYSDPNPSPEVPPSGFFRRIFWRPTKYRFVPLSLDDPRHPCCFVNGHQSVEAKIEWLQFRIDEDESLTHRFALFDRRPAWEEEHGASVVFRDGVPVAVTEHDVGLAKYDGV